MAKPAPSRPQRRRPRLILGPGLVIAVLLSFYIAYQRGAFKKPPPPVIEHVPAAGPQEPPAADISFLLERSSQLRLSAEQQQKLRSLRREWEQATADQRAALEREQKELERFMSEAAKGGKRTPLEEIQRRAAPVSELSSQLAAARRSYWQRALLVLDPDQRKAAQKALSEHLKPGDPPRRQARKRAAGELPG